MLKFLIKTEIKNQQLLLLFQQLPTLRQKSIWSLRALVKHSKHAAYSMPPTPGVFDLTSPGISTVCFILLCRNRWKISREHIFISKGTTSKLQEGMLVEIYYLTLSNHELQIASRVFKLCQGRTYFNVVDKFQISCAVHMLNNGGSIIESRQSQEKFLGIKVSKTTNFI